MRLVPRRLIAVASAMALSAGLLVAGSGQQQVQAAPVVDATAKKKTDKTSAVEKRRSKAVKTPKLKWYSCYGYAKCATVKVPRDYDKPKGKKVELAVLKVPAANQKKKLGTLFVNPGGPGGSGTEIAYFSGDFLSTSVTSRFDVVGFDPRGIAFSDNVKCFASPRQGEPVQNSIYSVAFPYGAKQEKVARKAWDKQAKGCSTTGKPLSGAMSTAEAARDMDLLRRGVGDKKLTYLGFSYGSYLGEVYANLYPDRVRAIAIDGVLDPVQWTGTKKSAKDPVGNRVRSAAGGSRALRQLLVRCDQAGPTKCSFAAGNPVTKFEQIAQRLRKAPLVEIDPETGDRYVTTYADFVDVTQFLLAYGDFAIDDVANYADALYDVLYTSGTTAKATAQRQVAVGRLQRIEKAVTAAQQPTKIPGRAYAFPYDNSLDGYLSVICTDSRNTKNLKSFGKIAAAADKKAPYFGRLWLWDSAGCSSKKWTVEDEDAYRGPFTKRTSAPVLIVGNYWDPSTNYQGAVSTAQRMPNSRLLLSNSWGHTAYGVSSCVTNAMDRYLVSKKLPTKGTVCQGAYQPFTEELGTDTSAARSANQLPPRLIVGPGRPTRR
jgi:pimeloyl-ACP methyl ester carboxylesterase